MLNRIDQLLNDLQEEAIEKLLTSEEQKVYRSPTLWAAFVSTHDVREWSRIQNKILNYVYKNIQLTKEHYLEMSKGESNNL